MAVFSNNHNISSFLTVSPHILHDLITKVKLLKFFSFHVVFVKEIVTAIDGILV